MKIISKSLKKNHNVSEESDTAIFFRYIGFFIFILLAVYVFFFFISHIIIQFVSIEDEQEFFSWEQKIFSGGALPQELKTRYADIPYNIKVIQMDGEENAFASLGGSIYITEALLDNTASYEALDFIIGHEIAHIENRDVLRGMISNFPVVILLTLFGGDYGTQIFNSIIGNTHSRMMESKADIAALDFVYSRNQHIGCAVDFFISKDSVSTNISEIFSTHPITKFRIQRVEKYIETQGYTSRECTPLKL